MTREGKRQMLFAVVCLDRPDSASIRSRSLDEHRRYVDAHASSIVNSGPLLDDDGTTRSGQLFILDVPDRPSAAAFIHADPFTAAGVFETVLIRQFVPVFSDGSRERVL
jgi:uncharacterized protein